MARENQQQKKGIPSSNPIFLNTVGSPPPPNNTKHRLSVEYWKDIQRQKQEWANRNTP